MLEGIIYLTLTPSNVNYFNELIQISYSMKSGEWHELQIYQRINTSSNKCFHKWCVKRIASLQFVKIKPILFGFSN